MKTEILVGIGIAAVAGVALVIIAKKSFTAAPIPTAKNPAAANSPAGSPTTAYVTAATDFFGWLTGPSNNTASTNSTVTTPADTQSAYSSALDALFA